MRRMLRAMGSRWAALLLVGLGACDGDLRVTNLTSSTDVVTDGTVVARTDRGIYAPGAPIVFEIINRSGRTIGSGACRGPLQRFVGSAWVPIDGGEGCTRQLILIRPGTRFTIGSVAPRLLPAGRYRVLFGFEEAGPVPAVYAAPVAVAEFEIGPSATPVVRLPAMDVATDSSAGIATVRTRESHYYRGSGIELYVINRGPTPLWANLCPEYLDKRDGDSWIQADGPGSPCFAAMITVRTRGDSARAVRVFPSDLPPGEYRVRFESLTREGTNQKLDRAYRVSNGFVVE